VFEKSDRETEKSQKKVKKSLEIFGRNKKVRIFAARLRNNGKFIDKIERER